MKQQLTVEGSIFMPKVSTALMVFAITWAFLVILCLGSGIVGFTQRLSSWNIISEQIILGFYGSLGNLLIASCFNLFSRKFRLGYFLLTVGLVNGVGWGLWYLPYYKYLPARLEIGLTILLTLICLTAAFVAWKVSQIGLSKRT